MSPVPKITTSHEFTREEVALALRNPGMPLEGLRYPITPIGMHYLLIHFDIPFIDPTTYELPVAGRVRNPLNLTLEELKARPTITMPVIMERLGVPNGQARRCVQYSRRPICSTTWSRSFSRATIGVSTKTSSRTMSEACRSRKLCKRK